MKFKQQLSQQKSQQKSQQNNQQNLWQQLISSCNIKMLWALLFMPLMSIPVAASQVVADTAQVKTLKQKIQNRGRVLLRHVEPVYPQSAQAKNLAGSVTLRFTVKKDGSIGQIEVVESYPEKVFDTAAISALMQWRYQAVGQPIRGLFTRFDFKPMP